MSGRIPVSFVVDHMATGGAERHALALANGLDRDAFDVSLFTLKPGGALESLIDRERLAAEACVDVRRKLDFQATDRLRAAFDQTRCAVTVAANPYATLYAWLAARRSSARPAVISTFHSTVLPGLKNQLQMLFYRAVFPQCDELVYVCRNQQQYWRRRGLFARAERVIYNGIDTRAYSVAATDQSAREVRAALGIPADAYVVGICAVLRPEKAHMDLLRAVAALHRERRDVHCLVIGDGPERARIEAAVPGLGLTGHVVVTGYKMDVRPYVGACDVLALPSRSVETFSLSALESMAMGKPMVMSRTGGAAEQVVDGTTGLLFEPGDVAALTRHLGALGSGELRSRMGRAAASRVREHFTLAGMLDEYATMLRAHAAR